MKQFLFFLTASFLFVACNDTKGKETNPGQPTAETNVDIAALNKNFDAAWNAKDSAKIVGMMDDDVKLLNAKEVLSGKNELAAKWVSHSLPVASNLKTNVVSSDAGTQLAYEAGTFALDVTLPNQKPFPATGNYTFIWKKQADNSWKIHLIQIEDHAPETAAKK